MSKSRKIIVRQIQEINCMPVCISRVGQTVISGMDIVIYMVETDCKTPPGIISYRLDSV